MLTPPSYREPNSRFLGIFLNVLFFRFSRVPYLAVFDLNRPNLQISDREKMAKKNQENFQNHKFRQEGTKLFLCVESFCLRVNR